MAIKRPAPPHGGQRIRMRMLHANAPRVRVRREVLQ
jgi:hypothetical protein